VDVEHFSSALRDGMTIPSDLASLPSPRIGFVGTIDPLWVNLQLLDQLARLRPEWSVVLIGPLSKQISQRDLPPRLVYLGPRPYSALPGYLKGLEVCLIPFRDNSISRSASPLKLYEYLAAGREVVTTPVPDPGPLAPYVRVAEGGLGFVRVIEEVLPGVGDPKASWRRVEAVREHSWDRRAESALQEIRRALGGDRGTLL
jgi:glycosyltransferase involved in cell wall biosynthesis